MEPEQDDSRFVEVDKPYTSLGSGWMAKVGTWPVYVLFGATVLVMAMAVVFFLSKGGHKDEAGSALKSLSHIENKLELLGARVDELQARLETVSAKIDAVGGNTKAISALAESIRSLRVEIKHPVAIKATPPVKKEVAKSVKAAAGGHDRYHVVKKGETIYRIAQNYRISVSRLMSENHLTPKSVIHPGDRLLVGK